MRQTQRNLSINISAKPLIFRLFLFLKCTINVEHTAGSIFGEIVMNLSYSTATVAGSVLASVSKITKQYQENW